MILKMLEIFFRVTYFLMINYINYLSSLNLYKYYFGIKTFSLKIIRYSIWGIYHYKKKKTKFGFNNIINK